MTIERVSLDQVLQETPIPPGRELPPLTKVGYKLALFIFFYLSAVTVILLGDLLFSAPSLPTGSSLDNTQLSQYQQLSQIATERTLKLIDALVIKGFLPIFTAVLGYIFGTRGMDKVEG